MDVFSVSIGIELDTFDNPSRKKAKKYTLDLKM